MSALLALVLAAGACAASAAPAQGLGDPAQGLGAPAQGLGAPASGADPRRLSDQDRRRALFLFDLLVEDGRTEEAEAFQKERYELGLDTAAWTLRLARLRSAQRRHGESAELYRRLLADSPDDAGLQIQLALQEEAAGRPEEGRRILEKTRTLSSDPVIPYRLAELGFGRGDAASGRRWAQTALAELPSAGRGSERRMRLRLRARLGYDDALDGDYAKAVDREPGEPELLSDWASALLRAGAPAEAGEPLALLRERFPDHDLETRRLEAERWRRLGDRTARRAHLDRSLALYRDEPDFLYARAEDALRAKDWARAEADALRLSSSPAYAAAADELLLEARDGGRLHAGPTVRWRDSTSTRVLELGAAVRGLPARGWRARADAGRAAYARKSTGKTTTLSGLHAEAARVRPAWEAGLDADLRGGDGLTALSPGVFGAYRRGDAFSASARAAARRLWNDSAEAAVAGVLTDDFDGVVRARPARRLALSLQGSYNRLSARAGGRGAQTVLAPEAVLVLLDRPFYLAAGYRYARVDASGDAAFFAALPLVTRSRVHYASLNAGRRWRAGRLRAEGYVFNGHEPERGRRFGSGDLLGLGTALEAAVSRLTLSAAYDLSLEDAAGVGGRSHSLRLTALWRFGADTPAAAEERAR